MGWRWGDWKLRADHCDDEKKLVFRRTLNSEPPND